MASSEEEMTDNFEEEEGEEESPTPFPLDPNNNNPNFDDPNKPKPLLEQYRETRLAEEGASNSERTMLEGRIRAIIAANPKVEIGKPSQLQEKLSEMSIEQLRFALQSAEDQIGVSNPFGISKALLKMFDYAIEQLTGRRLNPDAYGDCQLLGTMNRLVPNITHQYQDPILMVTKALQYIENPQSIPLPFPAIPNTD